MYEWVIIAVVVLFIIFLITKSQDAIFIVNITKKYLWRIAFVLFIAFIAFSFYQIHTTYDVDLRTKEGIVQVAKVYWTWISSVFNNIGEITGNAIKQDWGPLNKSVQK